jgi:hypothetical protein
VIAVLTPTVCPFMRAKQQMIFFAKVGMISNTERDRDRERETETERERGGGRERETDRQDRIVK